MLNISKFAPDDVVELVAVILEKLDVALEQVHPVAVQRLYVPVHYTGRQFVIDGDMRIMGLLNKFGDQFSNALVPRVRAQPVVIHCRGRHQRQSQEAQQCAGDPAVATLGVSVQGNLHIIRLTLFHSSSVG
jgi:hypothetical protein